MLIEEPSLSDRIDGLIGLLLGRLHMDTGRFHEGIVFGGGIIVDGLEVSDDAFPLSLIVLFRDGKLSQRSRLIAMPAAGPKVTEGRERRRDKRDINTRQPLLGGGGFTKAKRGSEKALYRRLSVIIIVYILIRVQQLKEALKYTQRTIQQTIRYPNCVSKPRKHPKISTKIHNACSN